MARPCLVTRIGDMPRWIRDGETGFVAERAELEEVGRALERAWEARPRLREMGRRGAGGAPRALPRGSGRRVRGEPARRQPRPRPPVSRRGGAGYRGTNESSTSWWALSFMNPVEPPVVEPPAAPPDLEQLRRSPPRRAGSRSRPAPACRGRSGSARAGGRPRAGSGTAARTPAASARTSSAPRTGRRARGSGPRPSRRRSRPPRAGRPSRAPLLPAPAAQVRVREDAGAERGERRSRSTV